VAVKLAERAVAAIAALLLAKLGAQLTAIDTDRSDTITTAGTTTTYYEYPKAVISGGQTHIEVFEDGFDFLTPYSDPGAQRAAYTIPLTVRVTFFNRDQDTEAKFVTRARRLATGVFNVINKNPTLAVADAAIKLVVVMGVEPEWIVESVESTEITKSVVTLRLEVGCEEVQ